MSTGTQLPAVSDGNYFRPRLSAVAASAITKPSFIGLTSFGVMSVIIMLNLNGLSAMMLGVLQLFSILILLCCFGCFGAFEFSFRDSLGHAGAWFFGFLFYYLFVGTIGGFDKPQALSFLGQELGATVLVVVASAMAARHIMLTYSFRGLTRWLFLLSLGAAGLVFISMKTRVFYEEHLKSMDHSRYSGSFANPNDSGAAMCIGLGVGFAYLIFAKRKLPVMAGIVAIGVALTASFSRSAFVAVAILIVLQIFFSPIIKRKGLAFVLVFLSLGLVWLIAIVSQKSDMLVGTQRARLAYVYDLFTKGELNAEHSGRYELTQEAIQMCKDAPAFGNGLGALHAMPINVVGCHNTYLMVLGESGIGALVLLVCFLGVLAWEAWKCPRGPVRTFILSYLVVLSTAMMSSHNTLGQRNHNLMIGCCIGIIAGYKELQRRNQSLVQQPKSRLAALPSYSNPRLPQFGGSA